MPSPSPNPVLNAAADLVRANNAGITDAGVVTILQTNPAPAYLSVPQRFNTVSTYEMFLIVVATDDWGDIVRASNDAALAGGTAPQKTQHRHANNIRSLLERQDPGAVVDFANAALRSAVSSWFNTLASASIITAASRTALLARIQGNQSWQSHTGIDASILL